MITAIIFDLDSCLSAADETGVQLFRPAFDAITRANHGSHTEAILQEAFTEMWRVPFDTVAQKYFFTPAMRDAGWQELSPLEITTPMVGYGDLSALAELPVARFLVTSGFRRLQESKIRALGIAPLFKAIHVNAIDEEGRHGKQPIIEGILRDYKLQPAEVLIVGDSPDSELSVGRNLGICTVQTLRPGVPFSAAEAHHIHSLHELKEIVLSKESQQTRSV